MRFGGFDADEEERRDIACGLAFGDELENLAFAKRENVILLVDAGTIGGKYGSGDAWANVNLAAGDLAEGMEEIAGSLRFEDIAGDAGFERVGDVHVFAVLGEENDLGIGAGFLDFACGVEAVLRGHADIHHDDVRSQCAAEFERLETIGSFTNDEKAFPFEQRPETLSDEGVIIHEKNASGHVSPRKS